jgi:hypothetical protein
MMVRMADERDDSPDEREVLSNLPRTRPARRSARRAPATRPKPGATAKPAPPAQPADAPEAALPPLPPSRDAHRSPLTDLTVTGIELTGAVVQFGFSVTRAIVRATLGRVPRP